MACGWSTHRSCVFFIDAATSGGPIKALFGAGGLFIGIALLDQVLSIAATCLGETVAWTATNALRIDFTGHCLGLDQSFHKEHTPGELVSRIDGDANTLSNFFSQLVIHLVGNAMLVLGILTALWIEDWPVGLGIAAFAMIALVILVRVRTIAIPRWKRSESKWTSGMALLVSSSSGRRVFGQTGRLVM